ISVTVQLWADAVPCGTRILSRRSPSFSTISNMSPQLRPSTFPPRSRSQYPCRNRGDKIAQNGTHVTAEVASKGYERVRRQRSCAVLYRRLWTRRSHEGGTGPMSINLVAGTSAERCNVPIRATPWCGGPGGPRHG